MMGFGVLLLVVIFAVFIVTHMIQFDGDVDSAELATILALIIFLGILIYAALYALRGLL